MIPIIGAIIFIIGFVLLLISIDAWKKSKIQDYITHAKDGLENDFESNNRYNLNYKLGFKVVNGKNGKLKIVSQSKLHNSSFFTT